MNATIRKFGYPATLIRAWPHWLVLLRPAQPTLGSLVLAATADATAFGDLPGAAFTELAEATAAIERALGAAIGYERLNYLMLMMVDPHVHFHVLPRYAGTRQLAGLEIADPGWPGVPKMDEAVTLDQDQLTALIDALKAAFAAA
ncbi:HIT family protein [Rhizorhapis sp. SPR117]|uniref:HIT family protein n=1 Tax=Rhizorhapis sp. SPR117 TaxID=2912611 RepID=UPI001F2EDC1D|nr:HIT family protein [Rhizorhapis sp. SPR117]